MRKFGNVTRAKENTREVWIAVWLEQFLQDVRFGLRMLRKSPGFTVIAVFTLALGIGANTAIFSVVDTILFRPLPYHEANRIIWFHEEPDSHETHPDSIAPLIDYQRKYPEVLSLVSSINPVIAALTEVPQPQQIGGLGVSSDFFAIVGWYPSLGRSFSAEDEKPGALPVVIISDALWKKQFGADPGVIGRPVKLNNVSNTVIGVMPRGFESPLFPLFDMWVPQPLGGHQRSWIAQNADHRDLPAVTARLTTAEETMEGHGSHWQVVVQDLHAAMVYDVRPGLLLLLGCAAFVLLVACTNVANLLMARGTARRLEMTVRVASGASQGRIARQMLAESVVLGCLGGTAGLAVAYWTLKLLLALAPAGIPRLESAHLDLRVLVFAAAVSIVTALLFGAVPALSLMSMDPAGSLKEGTAGGAGGVRHSRMLKTLVAAEVAIALILMLGASLMARSFLRIRPSHPGFDPANKTSFTLIPLPWKYPTQASRLQYMNQVADRISSIPGVNAVAATDVLPMAAYWGYGGPVVIHPGTQGKAVIHAISPNYFEVMAIPLLSGRAFTKTDDARSHKVAIVSRGMTEQFWPGENVLGKHFTAERVIGEFEIVGVAGDIREKGTNPRKWAQFYVPLAQGIEMSETMVLSSTISPKILASSIRAAVLEIDSDQPIDLTNQFKPLEEIVSNNVATPRFEAYLVGSFAGIALLLAAVGIFGVISFSVKQRTREIGIRIALGASSRQIINSALGAMLLPVALGLATGWGATSGLLSSCPANSTD